MRAFFILLLLPSSVFAGDISLVLDSWSAHSKGDWNEENEGVGVEWVFDDTGWKTLLTAGTYKDSRTRKTYYAGAGMLYPLVGQTDWNLDAGAYLLYFNHDDIPYIPIRLVGYSLEGGELWRSQRAVSGAAYFAAIPGMAISYRRFGVNLAVMPPLDDFDPWVAALQFKITL